MTGEALTALGVVECAALIRSKEISPLELVQLFLDRIAEVDPRINSLITVTGELALEQARQAEEALARGSRSGGRPLGSLHGVPLVLKDLFETRGIRTTAGSKFFADHIPDKDARAYQSLKAEGAILLGKANMHEIALGLTSVNPHYGAVHNPWAVERVAGGSSGGSAAALAARLCPGALGSDTGGSIRVPAALCGIAGLKPTYGRVSLRGALPLSWNLDHAGPMARRVQDLAVLLQVIAGYDPEDPCSVDIPVADYTQHLEEGVSGWRIAIAEGEYFERSEVEILKLVSEAAVVFHGLGANVDRVELPDAHQAALSNGLMVPADAAVFHHERLNTHPEYFGADVLERLRTGAALGLDQYIRCRRDQVLLRRKFEEFFKDYDILLLPTTPIAAPYIEGPGAVEMARLLTRYTAPFNLTGMPAISILCGFTSQGLPAGLQMVTRPWAEAELLQAANAYERATEWYLREPE